MLRRFNDSALLREWTEQSLIVVRTHLVLVSGKLVLQKTFIADQLSIKRLAMSLDVAPELEP